MKIIFLILLVFIIVYIVNINKTSNTWGLYKYDDERLVHFEHFVENERLCKEYANFLKNKDNKQYYCKPE